ncbi:hypothetical protein [Parapedobacter pyrenivorans]|uniref:hypothetical protein n=1 Tax=Parapedobacter pyrenivorans TaxID=1305674 RepID=UPI00333FA285
MKTNLSKAGNDRQQWAVCDNSGKAQNGATEMTCRLTSPELRKRKETVIASLNRRGFIAASKPEEMETVKKLTISVLNRRS